MKTLKNVVAATIVCGVLLFSPSVVHANDPSAEAISIASSLKTYDESPDVRQKHKLSADIELKRRLMDRLLERNDENAKRLLKQASELGLDNLDIFTSFANITIFHSGDEARIKKDVEFLEKQTLSPNWQRKHLSYLYLGNHHVFSQNNLVALKSAQNALEAIPNIDDDLEVTDALYETYDLLHTAFIVDRNANKAIDATQKLIQIGNKTDRNIDNVAIVHNLAVLFSRARDFETASKLSSILIEMQSGKSKWQQAVANYGHGTHLSEAGHFSQAAPYLEKGAELASGTRLENTANARLALAYAKTKKTQKAIKLLKALKKVAQPGEQSWDKIVPILNQAEAEIAFNTGNYKAGYIFLDKWAASRTQLLESLLFEDRRRASEGLAMSERVSREREARLKSEIELSQSVASRGKLIAIFAGLLAIALGFIAFNLNKQRKRQVAINAELARARDRALAGEETKSKFISMMGHELRTPMNPIISLADILYTRADQPDTKQMLRMISASGRTMLSMVENILIVADETKKTLTISTQKTNFRDFVRFTNAGFQQDAEDKGLQYVSDINDNIPQFMNIDKLKLRTVLTNMLSNAVKFTSQGSIHVKMLMVQDPELGVCLLMSVRDTGVGMTQEEVAAVRAAFKRQDQSHTTHSDGVGVGLYVTDLYAKAHGGRLDISSYVDHGTRLDVYIPYNAAPKAQLAA